MEHLSQEQLDALVMGATSRDDGAVRHHLATCEACARRLAREAQLESELYEAAATAAREVVTARARPAPIQRWRFALSVAAALAVVAFGTWSLVSREKPGVAPPPARTLDVPSTRSAGPAATLHASPGLSGARSANPGAGHPSPGPQGSHDRSPGLAAPRGPSRGVYGLSPRDVCRCVTVEQGQGPPTDPGGSLLCPQPSDQ